MNKRMIGILPLFLLTASLAAQAQQDPFLGTWKENIAKGKYDPGPPPQAPGITKREAMGGGQFKTTTDGVNAQGSKTHTEYTFKLDGKDYPITGSQTYDMQSSRQIDAYTRLTVSKKNGAVVRMIRVTLSKDGKTGTNDSIGIDAQGRAYHNTAVYDKQ